MLEVGTGTGGLTQQMAPLAAAVVSVEVDRNLHQLAGEELFHFPNVTLLHTDVLKSKSRIEPAVLEAVERQLQAGPRRRLKLVANLPFNVATPLISNLLALDRPPCTMTVTVQKEVADRIVARPGVKDYGALAIWVQCQCQAEIFRVLAPIGLLATAQSLVGLCADRLGRNAAAAHSRSGLLSRLRAIDVLPSPQSAAQPTADARSGSARTRSTNCWPGWGWNRRCGPNDWGPKKCSASARPSARRASGMRIAARTRRPHTRGRVTKLSSRRLPPFDRGLTIY